MEDKCETSYRNLIISWLSQPVEKSQIWGDDGFVSLIEENQIKSYLYHPDMEIVQAIMQDKEDSNKDQEISVADLYNGTKIEKDVILLPAVENETKIRRDAWYKYHVTDADVTKREDGVTPLAVACYHGKCDIVYLLLHLLQHCPDVQSKDGTTPIMETVANVSDDTENRNLCIQHLFDYGASAYIQNKTGHNVLTLAAYKGNVAILKYLDLCCESPLDWNHRTEKGHTPLMSAVYGENCDVLHYLITVKKVNPLLKNNEFFNAMDISLLVNAPVKMIGLLAAYMSSEKQMHAYLKQQSEIVENIERKVRQNTGTCHKLELNFVGCLLSVAYLGCMPDVRDGIFDNNLVDCLDQCSIWKDISPHFKTEFWLILAAHIFRDGDNKAMERLLHTTWAILQFHNESIYLAECEVYRLDRFMGILTFFLLAENGQEWIKSHFNTYPELALRVSDYECPDDRFARGFYHEIMNLLKNFDIQEGLHLYEKQKWGKNNGCEKSLRKRISVLMPEVKSLITYAKRKYSELELKIKSLDKEKRSAKMRAKMKAFAYDNSLLQCAKVGSNGDSPNKGELYNDDGFKVVTRQQKRRNKKANTRKFIEALRSKKVLSSDGLIENDVECCTDSKYENFTTCDDKTVEEHKMSTREDLTATNKLTENDQSTKEVSNTCNTKVSKNQCDKPKGCVNGETVDKDTKATLTFQQNNKINKEEVSRMQAKKVAKKTNYTRIPFDPPRFRKEKETGRKQNRQTVQPFLDRSKKDIDNRNTKPTPKDSQMKQVTKRKNHGWEECVIENNREQTKDNVANNTICDTLNLPGNGNNEKKFSNRDTSQKHSHNFQSVWDIVEDTHVCVNEQMNAARNTDKTERLPETLQAAEDDRDVTSFVLDRNNLNLSQHSKGTTDFLDTNPEKLEEMYENNSGNTPVNDMDQTSVTECTPTLTSEWFCKTKNFHGNGKTGDERQPPANNTVQNLHPGYNFFELGTLKVDHEADNKVTEKAEVQNNSVRFQNCFNDPSIISMAQPVQNKQSEHDSLPTDANDGSFEGKQVPSVFPSASHEPLANLLEGYFPKPLSQDSDTPREQETDNHSVHNFSNESGYMSPSCQDEKAQEVPIFYKNWQRRSMRWRSLLTQLQSKPWLVKRIGTINVLLGDEIYISKGSCGTVVRVGIMDDGLEVAVKCMVKSYQGLIQNELKALREIQHPNIVQYKDNVEDHYFAYIALELCEYTLEEFVVELVKSKMLHLHSKRLCLQLMTGLKALHHAKILHMDLKPRNVLIDTNGNVRLTDFGLSHKLCEAETTFYHDADYGTRCWRAPETIGAVLTGAVKGKYKQTSDVYVAGMVLFFIHTGGRHPFEGNSQYTCEQKIVLGHSPNIALLPKDGIFSHLLSKMLTKDMNKRIGTDEAISHPFFWNDQARLDFLVCVGRDQELLTTMCLRFCPDKEEYLKTQVIFVDRKLTSWMGWKKEDFSSVFTILRKVMYDIDYRWREIPRSKKQRIGKPSTYILTCFPNLFMGVYTTVLESGWMARRGLRKYYNEKCN